MSIQRLAPHASDLEIAVTIPKAVRPYLTEMYQDEKEENETSDAYVLRILKERAHNFYITREAIATKTAMEAADATEEAAFNADLMALQDELT